MTAAPDATWTYDRSHYPEPLTPMTASLWFEAMGLGIQAACRELRAPFGGFRTTTFDHWAYESEVVPDWTPDPAGVPGRVPADRRPLAG